MTSQNIERKLYKIGQLTRLFGITSRTIRYYDQTGILPHIKRSTGGMRLFDDEDLDIIRRVRQIQRNDSISLEKIRQQLYGTPVSPTTAMVITDELAVLPELHEMPIRVLPVHRAVGTTPFTGSSAEFWAACDASNAPPSVVAPSVETIASLFQECITNGFTQLFCIFSSRTLSDLSTHATLAASQWETDESISISVFDGGCAGPALGLLSAHIAKAIIANEPSAQVSSLITKSIPMAHLICMSTSTTDLVSGTHFATTTASSPTQLMVRNMLNFIPISKLDPKSGEFETVCCERNTADAVSKIIDMIFTEIQQRGKYVNEVAIAHDNLDEPAQQIGSRLQELIPEVRVKVYRQSQALSAFLGRSSMSVSVG